MYAVELFSVNVDKILLFQVGEGEKLVRAMFAVAKELQPAIIFIGKMLHLYICQCNNHPELLSLFMQRFPETP